jgi:acetyl-CoA carboxylase carboxyl transferase subunit alpha
LWKDATQAGRAAESLRLTAKDLIDFKLIDEVVGEPFEWQIPVGEEESKGSGFDEIALSLKQVLYKGVKDLTQLEDRQRLALRYKKFRKMGQWL